MKNNNKNVLGAIGNTPLVQLTHLNGSEGVKIFAKLEDARHHLEWGRGRKLRRHAEETGLQARLADESAQQARLDAALAAQAADPDSYRIQWHPEGPLQEARR